MTKRVLRHECKPPRLQRRARPERASGFRRRAVVDNTSASKATAQLASVALSRKLATSAIVRRGNRPPHESDLRFEASVTSTQPLPRAVKATTTTALSPQLATGVDTMWGISRFALTPHTSHTPSPHPPRTAAHAWCCGSLGNLGCAARRCSCSARSRCPRPIGSSSHAHSAASPMVGSASHRPTGPAWLAPCCCGRARSHLSRS
jgi:hypothetical protein